MILIPRDDRYELPWWERGNLSAIPAPSGLTSNFIDPPSKAWLDIVTQSVCLTVATLLVAVRMYTKVKVLKKSGWDDYTSFLAWLGLIAYAIICLESDHHGNGRHLWDITWYQYVAYAKSDYAIEIVYSPVIFLTKASILLLYLRVFNVVHRTCVILHIVLWANFAFYLAAIVGEAFQCLPVQKVWLPVPGHCINEKAAQTTSSAINAVSDFVILVLPIANVWGLQLYNKRRVGLLTIFSFGILACITSIVRLVIFAQKPVGGAVDVTWDYYSLNLLGTAEITCGIICGCLPALPAFIRHVSDLKIKSSKNGHNRSPSMFTSGSPGTGRPMLKPPSPPGTCIALRPLPRNSTVYRTVKAAFPTTPRLKGKSGNGRHRWEELDELEYVAGDERYAVKEFVTVEPQLPSPALH